MRLIRRISIASLVVSVATLALVLVMFVGDRWESAEDTQNFTEDEVERLVRDSVGKADCFEQELEIKFLQLRGHALILSKPTVTIEHSFKPNGLWLVDVTTGWDLESESEDWKEVWADRTPYVVDRDTGFEDESPTFNDDMDKLERKCIYRVNDHTGDVSSFQ